MDPRRQQAVEPLPRGTPFARGYERLSSRCTGGRCTLPQYPVEPCGATRSKHGGVMKNREQEQSHTICPVAAANTAGTGDAPATMRELPCRRPGPFPHRPRHTLVQWKTGYTIGLLIVLCGFSVLIVGWEVITDIEFPQMSTGMRHALLTLRAAIVTALAAAIVYLLMRRQQRRLADTAEQLARLLESYQAGSDKPVRFENPHLVPCHEALDCDVPDCPARHSQDDRCWQIMARHRMNGSDGSPRLELQQCMDCEVYRRSCPDRLTELGEAFNNLMFLLETEARRTRRMQSQLLEREKMAAIGQISAGVAHEIGNPLSSISSVVQMLTRRNACDDSRQQLALIETHIQRISAIVRQLVTFARPAAERWERIDLRELLKDVIRLVSYDRRARNVNISFEADTNLPRTYGLRDQLQQVFLNLSLNALDAMPEGGTLRIGLEAQRDRLVTRIEDSGCGIAPDTGRRVFEPFFTTKPPGKGAGLGLAVSYGIIRKHEGVINFEPNTALGRGTVFTVEIPINQEPPEREHAQSHDSAGG